MRTEPIPTVTTSSIALGAHRLLPVQSPEEYNPPHPPEHASRSDASPLPRRQEEERRGFILIFRPKKTRQLQTGGRRDISKWRSQWPILLLVPLNLALAYKWENVSGDPCRLGFRPAGKGPPIVIFILDMVGYDNAFTGVGQIRNKLPHLKAFSEEATVFHQAQAAGGYTHISLPSLMLQDDVSEFLISPTGTTRWGLQNNSDAPLRPAGDFPRALPYRVRASGSRAFYFGYAFPYKQMMPGAWDEAYILPFYAVSLPKPTSRWASLLIQYWLRYVRVSKDPFAALVRARGLHLVLENQHWRAITQDIYSTSRR